MSPIRSCPRVAKPRNFFPIRTMAATEIGTTTTETVASFQFW